jgi:hypothetical protein
LFELVSDSQRSPLIALVEQTLEEMAPAMRSHVNKMIAFFEEKPHEVAQALERYLELVAARRTTVAEKCEQAATVLMSAEPLSAERLDRLKELAASAEKDVAYATFFIEAAILFDRSAKDGRLLDQDWALRTIQTLKEHRVEESRSQKIVLEEIRKQVIEIHESAQIGDFATSQAFGFSDFPYFAIIGMLNAEQFSSWAIGLNPLQRIESLSFSGSFNAVEKTDSFKF